MKTALPIHIALALAALAWANNPAAAEDASAAFQALGDQTIVSRSLTLGDLGITEPIVLGSMDAHREFYLPVPAGQPLIEPNLDFKAHYLRGDGGHTTFLVSIDGHPVAARAPDLSAGGVDLVLGADNAPRPSGFVRLGVAWSSSIDTEVCGAFLPIGNVFQIDRDTRLTFSFDASKIDSLAAAWSAMPIDPVLLVSGRNLQPESYDAAWRLALALSQAGKRPKIQALPAVGDEIDRAGLTVPDGLADLPSFAALKGNGRHRLGSPAEVAAYIALGGVSAAIAVADTAMIAALKANFDALAQEATSAGAGDAFAKWRDKAMTIATPRPRDMIALATLGGLPVGSVGVDAAARAADLFNTLWRAVLVSPNAVVRASEFPSNEGNLVSLAALGGAPTSLDVVANAEWATSFNLDTAATHGGVPRELLIDVAAAPGASTSEPVASVFLNGYLLSARRLDANGQPERIAATVPSYALRAANTLVVSFQRQPVSDRCRDTPQPFPVAVLPSSVVRLGPLPSDSGFLGARTRLAGSAELIIPSTYLTNAPETLANVERLASASGLSAQNTTLVVAPVAPGVPLPVIQPPLKPFLAIDVAMPAGASASRFMVEGDRLKLSARSGETLLDVSRVGPLAVAEVTQIGSVSGVRIQQVGASSPRFRKPFLFADGDVAVLTDQGVAAQFDSTDPLGAKAQESPAPAGIPSALTVFDYWETKVVIGVIAFFALLFLLARIARKRANG